MNHPSDPRHPAGPWPPSSPQGPGGWPQQGAPAQGGWPQQGAPAQGGWPQQGPQAHGSQAWPGHGAPQAWPGGAPAVGAPAHPGPWGPPGAHAWPGGIYTPRPQHEFTKVENETLAGLALWSGTLGLLKIVQSGLGLAGGNIFGAVMELAVAISLLGGRKSLRAVVETEGNDVEHLMRAVEKIGTVFHLRLILLLIVTAIVGVGVIIIVALAASGEPFDFDF